MRHPRTTALLAATALALSGCSAGEKDANPPAPPTQEKPALRIDGAPDGFEATALPAHLAFGETAQVVTEPNDGALQFWSLNVEPLKTLSVEEVEANFGGPPLDDMSDVEKFVCVLSTVTYLGASGTPDDVYPVSVHPTTANGNSANAVTALGDLQPQLINDSAAAACGLDDSGLIPGEPGELVVGTQYREAALSWTSPAGVGNNPAGAEFTSAVTSVPELSRSESVYWS